MIVYKTTNILNGKIYIGQDKNNNPNYLGSGLLLKEAIEKYGKESFKKEILEECQNKEHLNEREIFWIKELKSLDKNIGYNIASGGQFGDVKHSEKFQATMKSEKYSNILSNVMSKYYENTEARNKTSESIKNSEKFKKVMQSEEYRNKMSQSKSNMTEEIRNKISEGRKNSPKCRGKWTNEMKQKQMETRRRNGFSK